MSICLDLRVHRICECVTKNVSYTNLIKRKQFVDCLHITYIAVTSVMFTKELKVDEEYGFYFYK